MTIRRHPAGSGHLVLAAQAAGVRDPRVLEAIRATPRAEFVPAEYARIADSDQPIPITHGQVTSQPSLSAAMVAALGLTGAEKVLEVGTGYGYQTALLARLAAQVISVEVWQDMAARAQRNLGRQGIGNVVVSVGDGSRGAPGRGPFDAIIISAAFTSVPPPLTAQLTAGGRLVQPIGPGGAEEVVLYERSDGGLARVRVLTSASFVPLYGRYGYPPSPR